MIEFLSGGNWVRNLLGSIASIATIGILIFAALNYFKRGRKSKSANVENSNKVKIKQSGGSDANVKGSHDIDIQQ